jgi:hypothetical protein
MLEFDFGVRCTISNQSFSVLLREEIQNFSFFTDTNCLDYNKLTNYLLLAFLPFTPDKR